MKTKEVKNSILISLTESANPPQYKGVRGKLNSGKHGQRAPA
jgi:hypothetical protein